MRILSKRVLVLGTLTVAALASLPGLAWLSLTHEPGFYREMVKRPRANRAKEARRFVAQSLQLRNDIVNEPNWEAVFSDEEVNAWLAEDLVTHFADQLPPEVHEPRVRFEMDCVTLAFGLDQGPVRSVIWVVARPHVAGPNVLELTFEKIRAGVLPVPAGKVLDRITRHAQGQGLDIHWKREAGLPVVVIRYTPHDGRDDVQLERVDLRDGQLRLAGRSDRKRGVVRRPTLPTRKVLQSKFPRRKTHAGFGPASPNATLRTSTSPTS